MDHHMDHTEWITKWIAACLALEVNEMPMGTLRKYEVQPLGNKGWRRSSWRWMEHDGTNDAGDWHVCFIWLSSCFMIFVIYGCFQAEAWGTSQCH